MVCTATLCLNMTAQVCDESLLRAGSWKPGQPETLNPEAMETFWNHARTLWQPVVFDVGASSGCFSLLAKYHPGMTVWAFEPIPSVFGLLEQNLMLNGLTGRIQAQPLALADYVGVGTLATPFPPRDSGISMLDPDVLDSDQWDKRVVLVTTADRFCYEQYIVRVDMIKVDVEGKELAVLRGAQGVIERDHPYLLVEYPTPQRGPDPVDIAEWLAQRGYRCEEKFGQLEAIYEA